MPCLSKIILIWQEASLCFLFSLSILLLINGSSVTSFYQLLLLFTHVHSLVLLSCMKRFTQGPAVVWIPFTCGIRRNQSSKHDWTQVQIWYNISSDDRFDVNTLQVLLPMCHNCYSILLTPALHKFEFDLIEFMKDKTF